MPLKLMNLSRRKRNLSIKFEKNLPSEALVSLHHRKLNGAFPSLVSAPKLPFRSHLMKLLNQMSNFLRLVVKENVVSAENYGY